MTAYKQIMPRLRTALIGMQKYNKIYTIHWVMYHTVHCDKQKEIKTEKQYILQSAM